MKIRNKWVILQLLSLLSFVTIFPALFSAVPLVLMRLEAPRATFYSLLVIANVLLTTYFLVANPQGVSLVAVYMGICFWGSLAGESLLKFFSNENKTNSDESKFWINYLGIGSIPVIIMVFILPFIGGHPETWFLSLKTWSEQNILNSPATLEILKELKKASGPEAEQTVKLLENSTLFTKQLFFLIPSYSLVAYYVMAFFTLFFTSRLGHLTNTVLDSKWDKSVLQSYRNPDWSIILVICVLAWSLFYKALPLSPFWIENGELIGSSLINVIGVFFFFQGFMVSLHFFDIWGIKGIFRTVVLFLLFVLALRALMILGLIDMWFDFRKKMLKRDIKNT